MTGDRSTRGYSPLDLILTGLCILMFSYTFIGHVPSGPFRLLIPYGSFPILIAVLLVAYLFETLRLIVEGNEGGRWQALGVNLACTLLAFVIARASYEAAKLFMGESWAFGCIPELTLLQVAIILLCPLGFRLLWEKVRQDKDDYKVNLWLRLFPQVIPSVIILVPVMVMGYGSLLYRMSFYPDIRFARESGVTFYYIDPNGKVIRSSLLSSQKPIAIPEVLRPHEILKYGAAPDYRLVAYDISTRGQRSINCSDCSFTSASVDAYRKSGRNEDWRNVYRVWGLHGETWRPVDMDTKNNSYVGVRMRYHASNAEFLYVRPNLENSDNRITLRAQLPTMEWVWRYVYLLPEGEILAQLGDNIVLLDLNTERIAFVAKGSRPVVTSF